MQYRKFGKLDWQTSALGFGCMRLPMLKDDTSKVDVPESIRMIRWAIDQGVNYIDTAYPYLGGQSEIIVGQALQDGYREKVMLATKSPVWKIEKPKDFHTLLDEQLTKLQTDHIDFYLLHALDKSRWDILMEQNIFAEAEKARAAGKIRHLGFSMHDSYEAFLEMVDGYDKWDFCQIQYNYSDENYQAGVRGLKYAAAKGLAVVIMEPLLGGKLVNPPEPVQAIWDEAETTRSAAEWGLQWLWNQPEVSVVLSGMSAMSHVEDNVFAANRSGIGTLTDAEMVLYERVRKTYDDLIAIPCTKCEYCMPCPNGVDIPGNFAIYNEGLMYNTADQARRRYGHKEAGSRASDCIACRICEDKCPQHIIISEWMVVVDEVLGGDAAYRSSL